MKNKTRENMKLWRKEFARRLNERMRHLDISKKELALLTGLDISHIYRLTKGQFDPRASTILKLASALKVDASYLLCFPNISIYN